MAASPPDDASNLFGDDPNHGGNHSAIAEPEIDPEEEELWSSRALLLVLLLLILSFWVSYTLKVRRIRTIHETLVALFAGTLVGFIIRITPGTLIQDMVSFKPTIMMNVLLPPIILSSGYDLRQEQFFRNFAVILTFAFIGTFISAVVIGTLVYIYALLGLEGLTPGIIECLAFGSTLSATDPVTVLAIFNTLKVEPKLYSIIFGESILNDAVAIVMFETLSQFHGSTPSVFSFFHGVGIFLLVFSVSLALGVVFALACSLMLKHSSLNRYPEIETCLVFLIAYTSYFFSNALMMSGIVSLLFCGITLKHYAYHNMSRRTQRTTRYIFHTLADLSENFIFIYLGLSLFTQANLVYKPLFIFVTFFAIFLARYAAVFPISKVINLIYRSRSRSRAHLLPTGTASTSQTDELPHSYQIMLWWAGLRGAVGVALAAGLQGQFAEALRTTVLVSVVLTMAFFGGTTSKMIGIVGIRTGVEEEEEWSSGEEDGDGWGDEGDGYGILGDGSRTETARLMEGSERERERNRNGGKGGGGGTTSPLMAPERDSVFARQQKRPPPSPPLRRNNSDISINSLDSDSELVLPNASGPGTNITAKPPGEVTGLAAAALQSANAVWRDGQWFTVLDERYLLPVFSNATASRRQQAKKTNRQSRMMSQGGASTSRQSLVFDADNEGSRAGSRNPSQNNSGDELDLSTFGNSTGGAGHGVAGAGATLGVGGRPLAYSSAPNSPWLTATDPGSRPGSANGDGSRRRGEGSDVRAMLESPASLMPMPFAMPSPGPGNHDRKTGSKID